MMDMKKGMMFGMECYFEELISRDLIKSAKLLEISEFNYDIARQNEYGQYELIKEEDIAKERLLEGKGIFYNGYVVFYYPANCLYICIWQQSCKMNQFKY